MIKTTKMGRCTLSCSDRFKELRHLEESDKKSWDTGTIFEKQTKQLNGESWSPRLIMAIVILRIWVRKNGCHPWRTAATRDDLSIAQIPSEKLYTCEPYKVIGKKVLPGLFLGYALYAGRIWKGDVLIADLEELETMDASEIYSKRLNAKEVIFPKQGEFILPIADGRIKTSGGDQELRTSTLVRHRPIQGESNIDFLGESEGSLPQPQDSFPDAGEAINDFWFMSGSFIYRHHVEPRVKLYSPREESFPIPLKYIDVSRTTHTNLDVKQEKRIDDYWNIDGSRDLSDPWTGGQRYGVPKAWLQQAAADSRGSRTCVCANTYQGGWHMQGVKDELTSCRGTI